LWAFFVSGVAAWGSKYCVEKFHTDLVKVTSVIGTAVALSAVIGMAVGGRFGAIFVTPTSRADGFCRFATLCAALAIPFPPLALLAPSFWLCVLGFFVTLVLLYAMLSPAATAALILAPADRPATAQSLLDISAQLLGFMPGPPVIGLVADAIGLEKALAATLIPSLCLLLMVYALTTRGITSLNKFEVEESRSGLAG
jgi:MFS family permease